MNKLETRPNLKLNQDLDNVSAKLKSNCDKEQKCPYHNTFTLVAEPNDKVIFDGRPATVLSVNGDDVVILQDGMTIDCTKRQIKIVGRTDTMDVPMKFKNGLPVTESKKNYVKCNIIGNPIMAMNESFLVDFNEWQRKKGRQKVHIICEDFQETFDIPKEDVAVLDFPGSNVQDAETEGYVPGAIVNGEGEPERKIMIKANEYAISTNDSDEIAVLFITNDGYKDGRVNKSMIKTLSV